MKWSTVASRPKLKWQVTHEMVHGSLGNGTMRVTILGVELWGLRFLVIYFRLATI